MINLIVASILHNIEAVPFRKRPPSKTNALPNMSTEDKELWTHFIKKYEKRILKIKDPIKQWAQTIAWFDDFKTNTPKTVLKKLAAESKKIPKPGPSKKPLHLTTKADKLWPEFWKKYGSKINKVPSGEDRWVMAIAIFRNYALKRNVIPFKGESSNVKETSDYLKNRFSVARKKLFNKSKSILKQFKNTIGKKILKEKLTDISYNKKQKMYNITTTSVLTLGDNNTFGKKSVVDYFKNKGFTKKGKKYILNVGQHKIIVTPNENKNKINFNLVVAFNRSQIEQIVGGDTNIDKKLSIFVRKSLKDSHVNNLIAKAEDLNDDEQALKAIKDEDLDYNEALSRYDSDGILNLGDVDDIDYRFNVVKTLVDKYKDHKNPVWEDMLQNRDLLDRTKDRDFNISIEEDDENDI